MARHFAPMLSSLLLLAPALAHGSCNGVSVQFFGFELGPIKGYPDNLSAGIKREGTAEIIEGVGLESLEGSSHGVAFDRIMVYFDRGVFIGFDAVGSIEGHADFGFGEMTSLLEQFSGQSLTLAGATGKTSCPNGAEVTISPTTWDNGKSRVRISYKDPHAIRRMQAHIREYCADAKRRRPQDSCK